MATSAVALRPSKGKSIAGQLTTGDGLAMAFTSLFALAIVVVTAMLVYQLWIHSSPAKEKFGLSFLTSTLWNPVTNEYGAAPFLYGTVVTSVVALMISVPLGVGAAIYLSELASPRVS